MSDVPTTGGSRPRRILEPIREFLQTESAGSLALIGATLLALVWANSPLSGAYFDLWHRPLTVGTGTLAISEDLQHWVNDGLMAIFFFIVALEIKRELVTGELRNPRTAALPVALAVGGMVVPALIFTALTAGTPESKGWAIPMATDIAFAVAALSLAGSRVPAGARLLLLSLAIVDDLGAILVIALFYSEGIAVEWLGAAAALVLVILAMRRINLASPLLYLLPGLALWYVTFRSGVHATLAGVALGLLTPTGDFQGRRPLEYLEHRLHPFTSYLVLPVFALANAGVVLGGQALREAAGSRLTWAVILGLVLGKAAGIVFAGWAALRLRLATIPDGMHLRDLAPIGLVAGIGFTVSLFIAGLSFAGTALDQAKAGILLGSGISAAAGLALILLRSRAGAPSAEPDSY
jgi:NhaA family Na+:H+ antiporter